LEIRQVRERTDDAIFPDGVRIGLQHEALRFDADFVAAKLSPRDVKLLLRSEAIEGRRDAAGCQRFLVGEKRDLGAAQVAGWLSPRTSLPL